MPIVDVASSEKNAIVDGPFGSNLKLTDYVPNGSVPVLTTRNLNGTYDPSEVRFIASKKFEEVKRSKVVGGDILVAKIGSVGKCSIYPMDAPFAIIPANLLKISVDDSIVDRGFLYWQLRGYEFQKQIRSIVAGNAQPAMSVKRFKTLEVNIPPLNEQRRIVAKLDELLAKVDAAKERLDKIPGILKRFRQSVLAAACSGKLTEEWRKRLGDDSDYVEMQGNEEESIPGSWTAVCTSELFSFVTSGSRGWARYYSDSGAVFLRIGNLDHDTIALDLADLQHVNPPKGAEAIRTRARKGDILVSITADVGMIALIDADIGEAYISQHISMARTKEGSNPAFLAYSLAAMNIGQRQFNALQRGATKVGLGLNDIKNIWVPQPTMEEKKTIVAQIERLWATADQIEERFTKAKAQVDKLTHSILARAFRGDLVPQDPNDEPAAKLLERIRAERSTIPAVRSVRAKVKPSTAKTRKKTKRSNRPWKWS